MSLNLQDGTGFDERLDPVSTVFAADAGVLEPAPGCLWIVRHAVDHDAAGPQLRVVAAERNRKGNRPDPASSILKIKGSEIQQTISELLMEVVGPYALPYQPEYLDDERLNEPPAGPDWAPSLAPTYFNPRKVSIYGGTNEIQKNIIAKAILGL